MNKESRPQATLASIMKSAKQSKADAEAGRVEDLDIHLARLRSYVEQRILEIEKARNSI